MLCTCPPGACNSRFARSWAVPPLEEIRRLRLRRLRQLLRTAPLGAGGMGALYRQCGLSDSAFTRRQYRLWCGETPAQSRILAGLGPVAPPG